MPTFTLDTNCLIALEERRHEAAAVNELVARHRAGASLVRVVATTAAENQRDGTVLDNFAGFQERLHKLGLEDLEILRPVCVLDLSYLDWCVLAHDEAEAEARNLHSVLFPTAPFDYVDAVPLGLDGQAREQAERKWRNQQLDVMVLHTHIMARADVFVTSDKNFRKTSKQARLAALGASLILTPSDAASYDRPPTT
ncbi:hypothetical protein [Kitasatospora sp. DSM 101779]|uniref:hypothetical protein n=1 Tax=Kitasatospora sp. DSM 101779 TaxID=2853165 RepID=UPI0021D8287D|nr:hypothetical protein [Kitasatospora sp. DSM 101779]MCU7822634.1 hypothetical protein [Kitasatospora sp. DSM 101779]